MNLALVDAEGAFPLFDLDASAGFAVPETDEEAGLVDFVFVSLLVLLGLSIVSDAPFFSAREFFLNLPRSSGSSESCSPSKDFPFESGVGEPDLHSAVRTIAFARGLSAAAPSLSPTAVESEDDPSPDASLKRLLEGEGDENVKAA